MIFLWDIHSTIFDEHKEYVPALKAAIQVFIDAVEGKIPEKFTSIEEFYKAVYTDLQKAHIALQSDWDNQSFDKQRMPTLRALFPDDHLYDATKEKAIQTRRDTSKALIKRHAYPGVPDLIKEMKSLGHSVYLCTDANESPIQDIMEALELNNVIDGCYCCASLRSTQESVTNTKIKCFSAGVFKPNARMIGEILLDHAKKFHNITNMTYEDVFQQTATHDFILKDAEDWAFTNLITSNELFQRLMGETVIIGDSWRDILLGRNSGILKIEAAYGQKPPINLEISHSDNPSVRQIKQNSRIRYNIDKKESLDTLHDVTYWMKTIGPEGKVVDRLNLLSKQDKTFILNNSKSDFVCKRSIDEIAWIKKMTSCVEIRKELGRRELVKSSTNSTVPQLNKKSVKAYPIWTNLFTPATNESLLINNPTLNKNLLPERAERRNSI